MITWTILKERRCKFCDIKTVMLVETETGAVTIVGTEVQSEAPAFDVETSSWSLEHLVAIKSIMTLMAFNCNCY